MINTISVSTSIYKVTQNQQTHDVVFYAYGQPVKTITAESNYTTDVLYGILLEEAVQYQQSREVTNE